MEKFCKNAVILGGYDLNFIRLVRTLRAAPAPVPAGAWSPEKRASPVRARGPVPGMAGLPGPPPFPACGSRTS